MRVARVRVRNSRLRFDFANANANANIANAIVHNCCLYFVYATVKYTYVRNYN